MQKDSNGGGTISASSLNPAALQTLRNAKRIAYLFSGGSMRCAFQVGVIEALDQLGIRPSLCIGISGGAWNAAAVSAGTQHRLRHYWRAFSRMPRIDLSNLLREQSPFIFGRLHERTFSRYVGSARLLAPGALPLFIGVTRLRDRSFVLRDIRSVEDPFKLLLASNYLPPWYTRTPLVDGERYGDGGATNNLPYEKAFEMGCDAVVIVSLKGESEGQLYRNPHDFDHVIPSPYAERCVVIRPRHRVPVRFTENRWHILRHLMDVGHLRTREILLGERDDRCEFRARGRSLSLTVLQLRSRVRLGLPRRREPADEPTLTLRRSGINRSTGLGRSPIFQRPPDIHGGERNLQQDERPSVVVNSPRDPEDIAPQE